MIVWDIVFILLAGCFGLVVGFVWGFADASGPGAHDDYAQGYEHGYSTGKREAEDAAYTRGFIEGRRNPLTISTDATKRKLPKPAKKITATKKATE